MKEQRPEIIRDNKKRGEWAEAVFAARAAENGLPVSRPSGDSESFDCVVGGPGKFVAVQVKCTIAQLPNGKGYICTLKSNNKAYAPGAFDFVAACVIPEDAWYIIPVEAIGGQVTISLCTVGTWAKFEKYREAWELLREASGCGESRFSQNHGEVKHPGQSTFPPCRNERDKGGATPASEGEESPLETKSGFHPSEPEPGSPGTPGLNGAPVDDSLGEPEETPMGPAMTRMHGAMSFFRNYLEKSGR